MGKSCLSTLLLRDVIECRLGFLESRFGTWCSSAKRENFYRITFLFYHEITFLLYHEISHCFKHIQEGPGNDHEMYTRWLQVGSFSGITRMHERGMSAGSCMGWPTNPEGCPSVEPYVLFESVTHTHLELTILANTGTTCRDTTSKPTEMHFACVRNFFLIFTQQHEKHTTLDWV